MAELSAIIETYYIIENDITNGKKVAIVSDSEYAINCECSYGEKCYKNGWNVDIPNKDLVKEVYDLYKNKKNIQYELDDIFQLKSKFPKMLDPHYDLKFEYAYRGMSMPIPDVIDILERNPFKESNLIKIQNLGSFKMFNL